MVRQVLAGLTTGFLWLSAFVSVHAQSPLSNLWKVTSPRPTTSGQIGTVSLQLVDTTRRDPYRPAGGSRELMVRLWYPAAFGQPCQPAQYTSPKIWAYLSHLSRFPVPSVPTNSCLAAAVAPGPHPVILFSHGYTGMLTDATFLFEDLASRGYVVASIAHTYESTAVEFADGRLITSLLGSFLAGDPRMDYESLRFARAVRLADVRFVLAELQQLNRKIDSPFQNKLNLAQVGVLGHSLGGEVALAALERDPRLRAAVSLDGVVSPDLAGGSAKPVLLLAAGREHWSGEECQLWGNLRGPRLAVNLRGADHFIPSDAIWLFQGVPGMAVSVGSMGRDRTIAALRNYVAAFFDAYLLGKPPDPLLNTTSSNYPDADVTGRRETLCRPNPVVGQGGLQ